MPVFNLSKFKGGFHELAFNQRKKPFGSLAARTLGDMYPDVALGAKNGIELTYDSILKGQDGITHRQKVMNKYLNIIDKPAVDGCDINYHNRRRHAGYCRKGSCRPAKES